MPRRGRHLTVAYVAGVLRRGLRLPIHGLSVLLLTCSLLQLQSTNALARDESPLLKLGEDKEWVSLTSYFSVLEDPGNKLTIEEVQHPEIASRFLSEHSPGEALNFTYSRSAFWLRIRIRNESNERTDRMLEIAKARLSSVQIYYPDENGIYRAFKTGELLPFSTRPYGNRFFVFPVSFLPHTEQVLYLRIKSTTGIIIPAKLWMPRAYHVYERWDYFSQALYFGMAAGLILFNLLLFIALRDLNYLLYVGASSSLAIALSAQNGLLAEYVLVDSSFMSTLFAPLGFAMATAIFIAFTRRMLSTQEFLPQVDPYLKLLIALQVFLSCGYVISYDNFSMPWQVLSAATMVTLMSVGVTCAYRRQRSAYFFMVAYVALFLAGLATNLTTIGVLPANLITTMNAVQLGSAVEMLVLAFALADRFIVIRREKEKTQREALIAQQNLVDELRSFKNDLEVRVAQRTSELQASNATLVSALHDLQVTQGKLIESEKQALHGERVAQHALAEQRQFVAMVSHEFRSPLAVIDAASQLLGKKFSQNSDIAPILARIRRGVSRLSGFVDNCLTEDRLDSGSFKLQLSSVDLPILMMTVAEGGRLLSERHRIIVDQDQEGGVLTADPLLLRILLHNLLSNAIKYSPPDSEVLLRCRNVEEGYLFEVIDQGDGIPDDELSLVFQKYVRGRAASSLPGAGLGLPLVSSIASLHGGRVEIKSRVGQGTNIAIYIPSSPMAH